jgi:hypothetical protein
MAAGESRVRVLILLPRLRLKCRLTSALTVGDALLNVGLLRVEALGIADGELEVLAPRDVEQFVGLAQLHGDGLFQEHVLAGQQAVARHGVMGGLRRRGNVDRVDLLHVEKLAPLGRGLARVGGGGHLGEPSRVDLGDVEAVDQGVGGAGIGADAAAPAGADDADVDPAHGLPQDFRCGWRAV